MAPPQRQLLLRALSLAALAAGSARAAPFSAKNKLFGMAIKNAPIPASPAEWLIFNHTCSAAPCVITQMHFPSIYPGGGDPWDWENGMLRIYVDGEAAPSIALTTGRESVHFRSSAFAPLPTGSGRFISSRSTELTAIAR